MGLTLLSLSIFFSLLSCFHLPYLPHCTWLCFYTASQPAWVWLCYCWSYLWLPPQLRSGQPTLLLWLWFCHHNSHLPPSIRKRGQNTFFLHTSFSRLHSWSSYEKKACIDSFLVKIPLLLSLIKSFLASVSTFDGILISILMTVLS